MRRAWLQFSTGYEEGKDLMRHGCILAVTMGDPGGVGPEIALKTLINPAVHKRCLPFVIGDFGVMEKVLGDLGEYDCAGKLRRVKAVDELETASGVIQVLDLGNVDIANHRYGEVRPEYGKAAGAYIEEAVRLAAAGKVQAVVTCPIQKEAFKTAGYPYPGHTEMLASLTSTKKYALMLQVDDFRVVHVTLHRALRDALKEITQERVGDVIRVADQGCKALGIERPRVAVAGLNPHAGEGGLFGDEEKLIIIPAIERAKRNGLNVEGPFAPDTFFPLLKGRRFDIGVCMYHDQGGIPMKLLAFDWNEAKGQWSTIRGVNVTLGLPIIRTSVSHGTGFDIAGQGIASSASLEEAIKTAAHMARIKFKSVLT
jgi:4-phospho-D-threonate 3-dehydrogenase / 4-phospho-D-erythronate 3-dehydrogenase